MLEPIPGLSVLKVLLPATKAVMPPAEPKLIPFDIKNTATALVTVDLSHNHTASRIIFQSGTQAYQLPITPWGYRPAP